jgi:2-methylcitrate dehydratase PrpD
MMPSHYARGFHATGTLGTLGAAAACAHLLGLSRDQWLHTMGIAAAQAAGLKSMFGTMTKPLHAGKAAQNGLLAARLAQRGFTAATDAFEAAQGLGDTQSDGLRPEALGQPIAETYLVRDVLFKYHAACYGTHSTIETLLRFREERELAVDSVAAIELRVPPASLAMCNIPDPTTPLEAKFSLRQTAAMAFLGMPTDESGFNPTAVADQRAAGVRSKVTVQGDDSVGRPGSLATGTLVTVRLNDGSEFSGSVDVDTPEPDLARQWAKLVAKCRGLAGPVIGPDQADRLVAAVQSLGSPDGTVLGLIALTERTLAEAR